MIALLLGCSPEVVDPGGTPVVPAEDVWSPAPATSWQWQLTGTIDTSVDVAMYDVDLFDAPDDVLDELHADGRVVICYFSAGSYEDWRPDAAAFPASAIGRRLDGWEGEWWLDVRDATVRDVMAARLDLALERGCDGVEPDNVDGYTNRPGFPFTDVDQLDFNRFLADEAHARGLSVGLKNDLDQVTALLPWFDWALNESCAEYDECALLAQFTDAEKAAFHVEYVDDWGDAGALASEVCDEGPGLSTLIKGWDLGPERLACPE